jgi:hypothetical protein
MDRSKVPGLDAETDVGIRILGRYCGCKGHSRTFNQSQTAGNRTVLFLSAMPEPGAQDELQRHHPLTKAVEKAAGTLPDLCGADSKKAVRKDVF